MGVWAVPTVSTPPRARTRCRRTLPTVLTRSEGTIRSDTRFPTLVCLRRRLLRPRAARRQSKGQGTNKSQDDVAVGNLFAWDDVCSDGDYDVCDRSGGRLVCRQGSVLEAGCTEAGSCKLTNKSCV